MDDVALANYIAGLHVGDVEAGRVDGFYAELLGVEASTLIRFSDYTLHKMRNRHGEINFQHYRHMPSILMSGFVAKGRTPSVLELWWAHPESTTVLFVVLKVTSKAEIYIETFHPIHRKEARRLVKRAREDGRLVREQTGAEGIIAPGVDHLFPKRKKKRA